MTLEVREGVIRLEPGDWVDLVESGAVPEEVASIDGVPEAITAAREPVFQLQLDVADARRRSRHHAWLAPEAVALLLQVRGDEHQLMALPPAFLAGTLARLTRLNPRKTVQHEPRAIEGDLLDDLFLDDEMRRMSAFQMLGAELAWVVATTGSENDLRLAVVEDEAGRWLVEPGDEHVLLTQTSATEIWRRLTTLIVDTTTPISGESP